jgi:hypothetical protein
MMIERVRLSQKIIDERKLSAAWSIKGQFQRHCLALMREHEQDDTIPTNGRFIYYEGEQRGYWPKHYDDKVRQPSDDVASALMYLREHDIIPWDWLTDETREVADWNCAPSVAEYLLDSVDRARVNPWGDDLAPLIICEARSAKGVLEHICRDYCAPITATNGQCGGFLRTDIAPYLMGEEGYNGRKIAYIGDHEIRGPADQIEDNTRCVLEEYVCFGQRLYWTRIALTQEQVDANPHLSGLIIHKKDGRYKPPKTYQAVECEAVGQRVLEDLLRQFLDDRLSQPLEDVLEQESEQREKLRSIIEKLVEDEE